MDLDWRDNEGRGAEDIARVSGSTRVVALIRFTIVMLAMLAMMRFTIIMMVTMMVVGISLLLHNGGQCLLYYVQFSQTCFYTDFRGARAQRMGGVWGREDETEDEETAGEDEEEADDEDKDEDEDKEEEDEEVGLRGRSPSGEGEGVSYEDEDVNRALVVNIKEKINKLEETVRF